MDCRFDSGLTSYLFFSSILRESSPALWSLQAMSWDVRKLRYTEGRITFGLKQAETGTPVAEVIGRMGVSEQTFYYWKKVYGGLGVGELQRVKQLEDKKRKLKQLVADLSLNKHILQDLLAKMYGPPPSGKREMRLAAQSA
jgi:putative transposase